MDTPNEQTVSELAHKLTRELSERGQVIEGGWRAYELLTGLLNASETQRAECRKAYFVGAQHCFASMMDMLDPGAEPTEAEMERMDKLDAELKAFVEELRETKWPMPPPSQN